LIHCGKGGIVRLTGVMGLFTIMSARSRAICLGSWETGFISVNLFSSGRMGITELAICRHSGQEYSPLLTTRLFWVPCPWMGRLGENYEIKTLWK